MLIDLSQESLDDLLLSLSEKRQNADILIESSEHLGRLRIHAGRLVDAEWDGERGFGALGPVLALREGRVEVRDNDGEGFRSFDRGVAEVLVSRQHVPTAFAQKSEHLSVGRFKQTERGLAPGAPGLKGASTLMGFPLVRRRQTATSKSEHVHDPQSLGVADSGAPPVVAASVRSEPPKRLSGPGGPRPTGTGYSSAPPPRLAEEQVTLPRSLSARGSTLSAVARKVLSDESLRDETSPEATVVHRRNSQTENWEAVPSRFEEEPETGPVSSLEFDQKALERLEALHECISSTSHPIPSREPDAAEEWPLSAPTTSTAGSVLSPSERGSSERPGLPRVGRYEILARLKSGGMGSVYLCRLSGSAGFRRLFAMKVLHQDLVHQDEVLELFFREASLLAQLHHPNIVGIVDVGSVEQPYLVLDYVEGGNLDELLRASPSVRHPGVIVAIVLDALNGLSSAHQLSDEEGQPLGLMHNDISPHNLLVGVDGTCRVTDFGVARARERNVVQPMMRGKPSFMAPERIREKPCDQRADLFSLGVVLYAALTGVNPFVGNTLEETLENVLSRPIQPPSEVGLRPPPCLDWVCMKALARNPAERFQSAEEMANQLRRIVAREDLLVAPSVVATWVRTVLASTLEARRAAALKGMSTVDGDHSSSIPPGVITPGLAVSAEGQLFSEPPPPSSSDFNEKTEVLSSAPLPPQGDRTHQRRKTVLYAALALSALALVFVFLFPEMTGKFLTRDAEPSRLTSEEAFERMKEEETRRAAIAREEARDEQGREDEPAAKEKPPGDDPKNEIHLPAIQPRRAYDE